MLSARRKDVRKDETPDDDIYCMSTRPCSTPALRKLIRCLARTVGVDKVAEEDSHHSNLCRPDYRAEDPPIAGNTIARKNVKGDSWTTGSSRIGLSGGGSSPRHRSTSLFRQRPWSKARSKASLISSDRSERDDTTSTAANAPTRLVRH